MLFLNLTPGEVSAYSYACKKLQHVLDKMSEARENLQEAAEASFDTAFAKCVYLFTSESLQFENEIHSQIYTFNCANTTATEQRLHSKKHKSLSIKNIDTLCTYLEESYIKSYRQLLNDKYLNSPLKNLINNHLQVLLSSLTQLRLFQQVKPSLN